MASTTTAEDGFLLGGEIDPATGDRLGPLVRYEPADLTTHGVIVGMTGSGKTGLGVICLEEALLAGIPSIVIDPKGDMTNLLLTFPELLPSDFEPWIDETEARAKGISVSELAGDKAEMWAGGLGDWDLGGDRIRELRASAQFTIYTPGSTAGVGLDIVGSLAAPPLGWDEAEETLREEIQGFVSGLLGLVGVDADPISSREHILLSNLIESSWRQGVDLDLASLLAHVQNPPFRKLGVLDVDVFFPAKDRTALAMTLNGLIASPAFAAWTAGDPLEVGGLLWTPNGTPRASIIYLAHLSDQERQFVVTLLLSRIVTWMRSQQGAGDLRALVYMDEVFGFAPPTAEPPAKKPLLTLLKQARAFGIGLLLSTQNPMDLDYKAMSNAGTWCIGRLQTERDKARLLEGLRSAQGGSDIDSLDSAISGLGTRQFLLHAAGRADPTIFTTRWALSYLAGPLTRDQIAPLVDRKTPEQADPAPPRPASPHPTTSQPAPPQPTTAQPAPPQPAQSPSETGTGDLADDETPVMPAVAAGIPVRHVAPAAPWLPAVGGSPTGARQVAGIAARVNLLYDDTTAGVDHTEEWEAVYTPLTQPFDAALGIDVDYDERDFTDQAPAAGIYVIPDAPVDTKVYISAAGRAIKDRLHRERAVTVMVNRELRLFSRVGESEDDFLRRCDEVAQERADEEAAKLGEKYRARIGRLADQVADAERRAAELEVDLESARDAQLLDQAGAVLGVLLGRKSTRAITGSARSRAATRSKEQRLISAREKAKDKATALAGLDEELRLELEELNDEWEARAAQVEPLEIGLEKSDITIVETALVWIPV